MSDTSRALSKNQVLDMAELDPATVLDIMFSDSTPNGCASTTESQGPIKNTDSLTDPAADNLRLSQV